MLYFADYALRKALKRLSQFVDARIVPTISSHPLSPQTKKIFVVLARAFPDEGFDQNKELAGDDLKLTRLGRFLVGRDQAEKAKAKREISATFITLIDHVPLDSIEVPPFTP